MVNSSIVASSSGGRPDGINEMYLMTVDVVAATAALDRGRVPVGAAAAVDALSGGKGDAQGPRDEFAAVRHAAGAAGADAERRVAAARGHRDAAAGCRVCGRARLLFRLGRP